MTMMRSVWVAVAAGLVLMMTGCAAQSVPEGDELYRDGEKHYLAMASMMHDIIMDIHAGDWEIPFGGHGAVPGDCDEDVADDGYSFHYRRTVDMVDLVDMDPQAISDRAAAAFTKAGLKPVTSIYGEGGDRPQWNIIAEDDTAGSIFVEIHPAEGWVGASADSPCYPGDSDDLGWMVTDDGNRSNDDVVWQTLPAFEGVDSVPQFYFPAGGPVYFNEDESPVIPQPVVTDPPKAPYGS